MEYNLYQYISDARETLDSLGVFIKIDKFKLSLVFISYIRF